MCDTHYLDGKIKNMGFSYWRNPNVMKICFYFFLAKLQFDFDVEIQNPQFRQYETYRNSFAIWKKIFFFFKAP